MNSAIETGASRKQDAVALAVVFAVMVGVRYLASAAGIALAGPLSTIAAVLVVFVFVHREGRGLAALGLNRPAHKGRALVMFLLAFAVTALSGLVLLSYLQGIYGVPESTGRFDYLEGNLVALVFSVVAIAWVAAAFGEEVLMRGFALPRLALLMGNSSPAWLLAVVAQAAVFGLLHHGTAGMIVSAVIGLGYGLIFWLGMRNLWPLIIAHAIPDTISLIGMYQGG